MSDCPSEFTPSKATSSKSRLDDLVEKIRAYVTHVVRTFSIIEAFLGVLYGGVLGACISNKDTGWLLLITLILSVIYLPMLIVKIRSQWMLPAHLFQNLQATEALAVTKKELARKASIDLFVDDAIKALNAGTCHISTGEPDATLCDEAVEVGLRTVLTAVINRPQQILDCDMALFSVGVLVSHRMVSQVAFPTWDDRFIVLRDDFRVQDEVHAGGFGELAPYLDAATGAMLMFRHAFELAKNENRMDIRRVSVGGKMVQLISSPIPLVCDENHANGVIWLCRECIESPPEDLGNILRIFGRIVANWLYKYNECVGQRTVTALSTQAASSAAEPREDPAGGLPQRSTEPPPVPSAPLMPGAPL